MREEISYRQRVKQEHLRKVREKQEREKLLHRQEQLKILDPLNSAKIAKSVIEQIDLNEIIELIDFFESPGQLYEAVTEAHARLEPVYKAAILNWLSDKTDLQPDSVSESQEVQDLLARCMNQGLSSICKSGPIGAHLAAYHSIAVAPPPDGENAGQKIEKGRSWKEISSEGN